MAYSCCGGVLLDESDGDGSVFLLLPHNAPLITRWDGPIVLVLVELEPMLVRQVDKAFDILSGEYCPRQIVLVRDVTYVDGVFPVVCSDK